MLLYRRKHDLCRAEGKPMFINAKLMYVRAKITQEHLHDLKDFMKPILPGMSVRNTE